MLAVNLFKAGEDLDVGVPLVCDKVLKSFGFAGRSFFFLLSFFFCKCPLINDKRKRSHARTKISHAG